MSQQHQFHFCLVICALHLIQLQKYCAVQCLEELIYNNNQYNQCNKKYLFSMKSTILCCLLLKILHQQLHQLFVSISNNFTKRNYLFIALITASSNKTASSLSDAGTAESKSISPEISPPLSPLVGTSK